MKIIFEGLDNTGKTTQINFLRQYYKDKGFICTKSSFIKGLTPDEYRNQAIKEYSNMFQIFKYNIDIICDRLHLGEYVYSPIYRKYSGEHVFELEKKYNLSKIDDLYLIVLIDEPKNVISREDGNSFTVNENKKEIEKILFEEAYELSNIKNINKILINIDKMSINDVHKKIINFIKGENNE